MLSTYKTQISKYASLLGDLRQYLLPLVAALCVLAWTIIWVLPNVYRAEARIYVDPRSVLDELLEGIVVNNTKLETDLLELSRVRLLTRENLAEVARQNDLFLEATSELEEQEIIDRLADTARITSKSNSRRLETQDLVISYESSDGEQAQQIVSSLLNTFIVNVLGTSRLDSTRSEKFLDEQIQTYKTLLDDAEDALKVFKAENIGVMPEEGSTFFTELQRVNTTLKEAKLALRESERRRDELTARFQGLTGGDGKKRDPAMIRRGKRIEDLENQLDSLVLRFTDNHPDIISIREQLSTLKRGYVPPPKGSNSPGSELAYAEFEVEVSRAVGDAAAAQARFDEMTERKAELESAIRTIPEIEAQLRKLTRDYSVYKDRYEQLLDRRESARLTGHAESSDNQVQFQIIEPPRTVPAPVGPNRPLLLTMAFLFAWGVAIAIPVLREALRPTIYDVRQLASLSKYAVLGEVSFDERRDLSMFVIVGAVTLLLYAIQMVIALFPDLFTAS